MLLIVASPRVADEHGVVVQGPSFAPSRAGPGNSDADTGLGHGAVVGVDGSTRGVF